MSCSFAPNRRSRGCAAALGIVVLVLLSAGPLPAQEVGSALPDFRAPPAAEDAEQHNWFDATPTSRCPWTIDYRFRALCDSKTSYEFGEPDGWSPLSQLNFSLNSCWQGLEVGLRDPDWAVHVEWLTPVQRGIQGEVSDWDWQDPQAPFTDLGYAREQWIEGQMLDAALDFKLGEGESGIPIELWLTGGFRWQRFDIQVYDLTQVKYDGVWPNPPYTHPGDVGTFNQQYYITYLGCQFRSTLNIFRSQVLYTTLQADGGFVAAYNIDHHAIREGKRYTMETTQGSSWRLAYTAELPINKRLSVGLQADYQVIQTHGAHRYYNEPLHIDETWYDGVSVTSNQTGLTAFLRLRM
jgi:hypothetical protein